MGHGGTYLYLPGFYTDLEDEYWHPVNNVALLGVAVERCTEVTVVTTP
jgi:hypothetical protein